MLLHANACPLAALSPCWCLRSAVSKIKAQKADAYVEYMELNLASFKWVPALVHIWGAWWDRGWRMSAAAACSRNAL